jgi:hypothetical protein
MGKDLSLDLAQIEPPVPLGEGDNCIHLLVNEGRLASDDGQPDNR